MDGFHFNPRRYENHLSGFGRKVMQVLIQKWKNDQFRAEVSMSRGCYRRGSANANPPHSRKVLQDKESFMSPALPAPPIIYEEFNTANEHDETPFDFYFGESNITDDNDIPTSVQLVNTVGASEKAAQIIETVSSDNLINPVIEGRIPNNSLKNLLNDEQAISHVATNRDKPGSGGNDIDWDNMFDTELFSHETVIANAQLVLEQTATPGTSTFNIQFSGETVNKKSVTKSKEFKEAKKNEIKQLKHKNQPISNAIPKKVKKAQLEQKLTFRKQKYTKAVKKWLEVVDPNNSVDGINSNEQKLHVEIVRDKVKEKPNKKVIQTQLANRDGIMKFGKPKSNNSKEKSAKSIDYESTTLGVINIVEHEALKKDIFENSEKENKMPTKNKDDKTTNKDKKNKAKFVAPLKSQIPVEDVELTITKIDENNQNHLDIFNSVENEDLILVLIYRNGFCQLNNQYTEDTSNPEGFILNIGDEFLYIRDYHHHTKEMLQLLLQKNNTVCYEGKKLLIHLKSKYDLDIFKITLIDAEVGGSLLAPDNPPENFSELQKLLSFTPQFTIATDCVLQKAAWYTSLLKECAVKLVSLLKEESLWNVFVNIEMKLVPIISDMEILGISVDIQKLKTMEEILLTKMKSIELECHKAAGRTFQINSPVQVRALIYDELKLDAKCNMKIRETLAQGAKSTSEAMLRGLVSVHPLPRLILEYRHLHKAHATFLAGIAQHVKEGVVRPTWVQTAAATGRIASNNPNLQAIPKVPFSLVLFPKYNDDSGTSKQEALNFRSVYTSRSGHSLLACDFKHVECRVFAHHAADAALTACLRAHGDLFRLLAHKWLQKPEGEVTAEDRERTKRIVYASLYGAGVRKLMDILGVGYEQALAVQTSFNGCFPSLKSFGQAVVRRCENSGRLSTLCGRVRRFPNIASRDFALKAQAERQAVNFIIQGSAADLCKVAMVEAQRRLVDGTPPPHARLLLQIHDELVWEVSDQHLHVAAAVIKRAMEECGVMSGMEDRLPVAVSVGKNWGEMVEYLTEAL